MTTVSGTSSNVAVPRSDPNDSMVADIDHKCFALQLDIFFQSLPEFFYFAHYSDLSDAQNYGGSGPIVVNTGPEAVFPETVTADKFPLFPFTNQFNTGIEINPANKVVSSRYSGSILS